MVICIFIANAKTTEAPDSTLRVNYFKMRFKKKSVEDRTGLGCRRNGVTDIINSRIHPPTDPCSF